MRRWFTVNAPAANQRGYTLIEIAVALCITGFVALAVVTTIYQLQAISNAHYAHITAVKQVENALHFLIRDIQCAQDPTEGTQASFPLTLAWKNWEDNIEYEVTYSLDESGILTRDNGTQTSVVAKNIDADSTNWTYDSSDHKMTIVITSKVQAGDKQATETREIEIIPRPGS